MKYKKWGDHMHYNLYFRLELNGFIGCYICIVCVYIYVSVKCYICVFTTMFTSILVNYSFSKYVLRASCVPDTVLFNLLLSLFYNYDPKTFSMASSDKEMEKNIKFIFNKFSIISAESISIYQDMFLQMRRTLCPKHTPPHKEKSKGICPRQQRPDF